MTGFEPRTSGVESNILPTEPQQLLRMTDLVWPYIAIAKVIIIALVQC